MPSGSELFIDSLRGLGATHIFTLVGDHLNDVLRVADARGMTVVDTRHESAAVHMADAWARLTGQPGISFVTGGPGHTNALSGMATAHATGVPVLAISGMANSAARDRNAFQDLDQLGQVHGITKYAAMSTHAGQLPFYAKRAWAEATQGRPGVSHLSIPVDVFTADAGDAYAPLPGPATPHRWRPDRQALDRALSLLRQAQRPVVIAGSGAWFSGAAESLQAFIEAAQIPLFTITLARGLVSDEHPLCYGYADPNLNAAAEQALRAADFVLVLGKRLDYRLRLGGAALFSPEARFVQADIHPEELGLNRRLDAALCGDVRASVEDLTEALRGDPLPDWSAWRAQITTWTQTWREQIERDAAEPTERLHPGAVMREVARWVPEDATLCFDGGDFVHWGRYTIPARRPGHWLRLGALAGLGVGFPASLTGQLLRRGSKSICITGDGSLGFYIAEMDTAVRHNLPVIILVGNDGGWGVERVLQEGTFDGARTVACELRRTRYDLVMKGFGGDGAHVTTLDQLRPALDAALESDKPFCINVEITGVASRLTKNSLSRKKKT